MLSAANPERNAMTLTEKLDQLNLDPEAKKHGDLVI
jgi:hypothetical protein